MNVQVIAEIGVNHGGSVSEAERLITAAAGSGADVVKFQTFNVDALAAPHAGLTEGQLTSLGRKESQLDALRPLALTRSAHERLMSVASSHGVEFMSTPFDVGSASLLCDLGLRRVKISSGDITNGPLLHRVATTFDEIYLSTGMSTLDEVAEALGLIALAREGSVVKRAAIRERAASRNFATLHGVVTLLQCNSSYPSPLEDMNISAMKSMSEEFGLSVGLSDHSQSVLAPSIAVALGACVIEKHLTLDRGQRGLDHAASLEPQAFQSMVDNIRETEVILGSKSKFVTESERATREIGRRGLYASRAISKGEVLGSANLVALRPETSFSPMDLWDYEGSRCPVNLAKGQPVDWAATS